MTRPLTITRWAHLRDTQGERVILPEGFPALIDYLAPISIFCGEGGPQEEGPFHPGYSPAIFSAAGRCKAGVESVDLLELEQDKGDATIAVMAAALQLLGLAAFIYPTKSHTAAAPRWRLLVPFSRPASPDEHRRAWHLLAGALAFWGVVVARAERDASRFWWWPSVPAQAPWEPVLVEGQELDVDTLPAAPVEETPSLAPTPPPLGPAEYTDAWTRGVAYARATPGDIGGEDNAENTTILLAAQLRRGFMLSEADTLAIMKEWNVKCRPPWTSEKLKYKVREGAKIAAVPLAGRLDEQPSRTLAATPQAPARPSREVIEEAARPRPCPVTPPPVTATSGTPAAMLDPPIVTPSAPDATPLPVSGMVAVAVPPPPAPPSPKRPPLRLVQPGEPAPVTPARFLRGDHLEIAEALIEHIHADVDELAYDEGALYRYEAASGLWRELDKSQLARGVHTFAGATVATKKGAEALKINTGTVDGAIEQAQHITRRKDFFADAPVGLAFSDGFMCAGPNGLEWQPHVPEHRARVGYSFPWATCGGMPCPRWIEFLEQVWPVSDSSEEDQQAKISLFQQFLGACLVGVATRYQICLVLVGEGSNGKSTAIKVAEALFPRRSLAHVAPQDLGDEYRLALLAGKLLNTIGELPTSEIMASDRFKAIVDGTEVTARHIRQEPITFHPRAGHLYAANKLPPVADMSHGFWSRFVVLRFSQVFERGTNGRELWRELVEAEGPAIIGWMLDGAAAVLAQRGYTMPSSSHHEIEAWRRRADTVAFFLDECCDLPGDSADPSVFWEQASRLFAAYTQFASDGNMKPVSVQTFRDRMTQLGHPQKRTATARTYPVTLKRSFQWREKHR